MKTSNRLCIKDSPQTRPNLINYTNSPEMCHIIDVAATLLPYVAYLHCAVPNSVRVYQHCAMPNSVGVLTSKSVLISSFRTPITNVLRSSRVSRKLGALIVRYSQKKECISFVFYFENSSDAITLEPLVPPIEVGFSLSAKYTLS